MNCNPALPLPYPWPTLALPCLALPLPCPCPASALGIGVDQRGSGWIRVDQTLGFSIFANSTLGTFTSAMINLWEIQALRNPTSMEFAFYDAWVVLLSVRIPLTS